jgi:hypothetical protein
MSRLVALAPVALLTTACAVRTPATALDVDARVAAASPVTRTMVLPTDGQAIAAWHLPPTNPWSRYEKLTLLTYLADTPVSATMPDVEVMEVVRRAQIAAARLAVAEVPADTMWVVDLRGAASVAFGATLSQQSPNAVAPVMTFNNWPSENEVVPAEQTLAALVTMSPRPLAADAQAVPVFLLDAWRLAFRDSEPDPSAVDNRYMLLASDFPDPATLRARGIRRVVYVVEDRGRVSTEEDDFHEIALAYQDAGIPFCLVDLQQLASVDLTPGPEQRQDERWAEYWDEWQTGVRSRSTVFDDPRFYARARGGFGGVRAAPVGRNYQPATPTVGGRTPGGMMSHGGRAYSGASPHVGVGGG